MGNRFVRWWKETARPRASRKQAVETAQYWLDLWADYGDPRHLDAAIKALRGTTEGASE